MAKLKSGRNTSGIKELRKAKKRTASNRRKKQLAYRLIREVKKAVKKKDFAAAKETLRKAISQLDKLAKRNIIHKNVANRKKSQLSKLVNSLSLSMAAEQSV